MTVFASAELDAPIARVWEIVGDFAGLPRWHPLIGRCDVVGEGVGAVRTIHFADWWAAERMERIDKDEHTITYAITDSSRPEVIGVVGSIRLEPLPGDRTRIDWTSGHQPNHPSAAAVNPGLESYYPTRIGHLRDVLANAR
jgi:uncharacterized protein YndB with AHSA1/START domain